MGHSEQDWVPALFKAIDARDADAFVAFLSPEVVFRFANAPPSRGRDATRDTVAGFFALIAGVSHRIDDIWSLDRSATVICRGEVRYKRHDGSELQAPFANVFRIDEQGITEYSIYVDASTLFA